MSENESAFPISEVRTHDGFGIREGQPGMSLRDWFAGQALNGLLSSHAGIHYERDAREAYRFADALLATRQGSAQ